MNIRKVLDTAQDATGGGIIGGATAGAVSSGLGIAPSVATSVIGGVVGAIVLVGLGILIHRYLSKSKAGIGSSLSVGGP